MNKKVVLAMVYGLLVSLTGVGVYVYLDGREKNNLTRSVQFLAYPQKDLPSAQVLPAMDDRRSEIKIESKPDIPNPTQLDMFTPDQIDENKTKIKETTPNSDVRGSYDQQQSAYDEKKLD